MEQVEILFELQEFSDGVDEREEVERDRLLFDGERSGTFGDGNECDENRILDEENNDEDGAATGTCAPA
jgi:hypothetical protein